MRGIIQQGFFWIKEHDEEEIKELYDALSVKIPGAEHTHLCKSGKWDGIKHYLDWQYKKFSANLLPLVKRKTKIDFEITDTDRVVKQFPYVPVLVQGVYSLYDLQENAIKSLLAANGGLAKAATNAGKTAVIAAIIEAIKDLPGSIFILERQENLLHQVEKEIKDCLVTPSLKKSVGRFTAKNRDFRKVIVGMVPSMHTALGRLRAGEETRDDLTLDAYLKQASAIIVDECHHATSASYLGVIFAANKDALRYGLSGTVWPENDHRGIAIREVFGDVVCEISNIELIERGISARPKIFMVESAMDAGFDEKVDQYKKRIHSTCFKYKNYGKGADGEDQGRLEFSIPTYTNLVREFVMNYAVRHNQEFQYLIDRIVRKHSQQSIVILSDWVDYANSLAKRLDAEVFTGESRNRQDILTGFAKGDIKRLVATSVIDEGISINRIEVLILATVGSSIRQFLQRLGRGLRRKEGDNTLSVYDFFRFGHEYLVEPSRRRVALWEGEGFEVIHMEEGSI